MRRAAYRAVNAEGPCLACDERYDDHLARRHRLYVAVEVVADLEAVRIRINVTYNELHGIPLVDRDYRPDLRRRTVGNAIIEARDARYDGIPRWASGIPLADSVSLMCFL